MTDKPAMTIEETAAQLAGWLTDPQFMKRHLVTALTEAYARGRRDGLDEAAKYSESLSWASSPSAVANQIRALKEKEPTT